MDGWEGYWSWLYLHLEWTYYDLWFIQYIRLVGIGACISYNKSTIPPYDWQCVNLICINTLSCLPIGWNTSTPPTLWYYWLVSGIKNINKVRGWVGMGRINDCSVHTVLYLMKQLKLYTSLYMTWTLDSHCLKCSLLTNNICPLGQTYRTSKNDQIWTKTCTILGYIFMTLSCTKYKPWVDKSRLDRGQFNICMIIQWMLLYAVYCNFNLNLHFHP